jgi:hypothetical protein
MTHIRTSNRATRGDSYYKNCVRIRWSRRDFVAAVYELWYLHGTKDRGVVYTQNQDLHGPSIVWLSGDSDLGSHESRRVRACSVVGINGAID